MLVDVTTEVAIERPIGVVSAFAANPDNVPSWYKNIRSVEWKTSRDVAVGAKIAFVAHFLGRRMAYTYEIVEHLPGKRLVMRTAEGPFPMETTYSWESIPSGTRMKLRNHGRPTGFSKLVAPFMSMAVRRANQQDLKTLKQLLESRPVGT